MKRENQTEQTVVRLGEDKKNEFITYFQVDEIDKKGNKSTKYHAVIGHSLLCTGDTEEEVKEWVFDNPAKIAICASMEYWHSLDEFKAFQKKLKEEKND
jgi:hypothetical protein